MVQRTAWHRRNSGRPVDEPESAPKSEQGFSMIELMMVVVVISILLLIAIPTFVGARKPAEDRHAQTILKTSLVAARTGSADTGDYAWVTLPLLQNEETSVLYVAGAAPALATQNEVSVATGVHLGDTYVILSSRSASGSCFAALTLTSGATQYQTTVAPACNAGAFAPGVGWGSSW